MGVKALRDATSETLETHRNDMDYTTFRRAKHVIQENARTLDACDALRAGDLTRLGHLINASHESLRSDFEVSNNALDVMVDIAQSQPGCYGARMTGAGFGGCAVAIVARASVQEFVGRVSEIYTSKTDHHPMVYVCEATDGTSVVDVSG
jgi:galactokinase